MAPPISEGWHEVMVDAYLLAQRVELGIEPGEADFVRSVANVWANGFREMPPEMLIAVSLELRVSDFMNDVYTMFPTMYGEAWEALGPAARFKSLAAGLIFSKTHPIDAIDLAFAPRTSCALTPRQNRPAYGPASTPP